MKQLSLALFLLYNLFVSVDRASAQTWISNNVPQNPWYATASSADGNKLVAAAGGGSIGPIYTSTNSGASWTPTRAPVTNWYSIASSADGTKLVAAANDHPRGGRIY